MAPEQRGSSSPFITHPPKFEPRIDMQDWCCSIRKWVNLIKTAQKFDNDRHYITTFKILGQALYNKGLPLEQQRLIDEAQRNGDINYLQTDDPIKAALEIVHIVAVEPPIQKVNRLISSFNKVSNCHRKGNEEISVFVSRFRSLAADHLEHTNSSPSSQIGQVLAITLLNNAYLEDSTLQQCKMALISLAEDRAKNEIQKNKTEVDPSVVREIKEAVVQNLELDDTGSNAADRRSKALEFNNEVTQYVKNISEIVEKLPPSANGIQQSWEEDDVTELFVLQKNETEIHLDDAVQVLRKLRTINQMEDALTEQKIQLLISRQVQKELTSFQASLLATAPPLGRATDSNDEDDSKSNKRKLNKRKNPDDKSHIKCFDCREKGHYRGDDECEDPSETTKKRKQSKAK